MKAEGAVEELEYGFPLCEREELEALEAEHHSAIRLDRGDRAGFA